MMLTLKLIKESLDSFLAKEHLSAPPVITMAPDIYNEVQPYYEEWFGFKKYIDSELPEGHIRIIGSTRHGETKALFKIKFP